MTLFEVIVLICVAVAALVIGFLSGCEKKGRSAKDYCFDKGGYYWSYESGCIYKNPTKD